MADIDLNVNNYTLSELMTIAGLDLDYVTKNDIIKNTDKLYNKFKVKNLPLAVFFLDVQSQLLQYTDGLDVPKDDNTEGKIIVEGFERAEAEEAADQEARSKEPIRSTALHSSWLWSEPTARCGALGLAECEGHRRHECLLPSHQGVLAAVHRGSQAGRPDAADARGKE